MTMAPIPIPASADLPPAGRAAWARSLTDDDSKHWPELVGQLVDLLRDMFEGERYDLARQVIAHSYEAIQGQRLDWFTSDSQTSRLLISLAGWSDPDGRGCTTENLRWLLDHLAIWDAADAKALEQVREDAGAQP